MNSRPTTAGILIALSCLLLSAAPGSATDQPPRDFVRSMADEVIVVLKTPGLDDDAKIGQIETIANRRFHFPTIARLVAARNWRRLEPAQKRQFADEFQKHLSVTYGRNINRFDNQTIEISGDRAEPRGDWTVMTKIVQPGGDDILVDYRLRPVNGEWRVIDVVVERISLVSNFRSQVQELFSKKGVEGTLTFLSEKNASGQSILPEDQAVPTR